MQCMLQYETNRCWGVAEEDGSPCKVVIGAPFIFLGDWWYVFAEICLGGDFSWSSHLVDKIMGGKGKERS